MGTQRESICIVVTLHESIWVGSFICNELPGKKTFSYVCAKGISILMRDVSCLGTSSSCNFTLTKLSLERNPFENDGALISTACLELGPPPLGDGGHPRGMDRHILWNHQENALY